MDDAPQAGTDRRVTVVADVADEGAPERARYLPLGYRVAAINAIVLVATVVVTILVLSPHKLSRFETDEAITLGLALVLIIGLNVVLLRRAVAPLQRLTALARRVDLARPGDRMPGAAPTSEAGELALAGLRERTGHFLPVAYLKRDNSPSRVLHRYSGDVIRLGPHVLDSAANL